MVDIEPKLADQPLRHRRPDESWLDWTKERYAHTLAEIELAETDRPGWERRYGRWPGQGYLNCLYIQRDQEAAHIAAHEEV